MHFLWEKQLLLLSLSIDSLINLKIQLEIVLSQEL